MSGDMWVGLCIGLLVTVANYGLGKLIRARRDAGVERADDNERGGE
jgi:hypothetical protein